MKYINKIYHGIESLEYREPADCVELRLYLLSLMREFVNHYTEMKDRRKSEVFTMFKELERLYKSFTAITLEPGRDYRAQFEFAKALISDQVERLSPSLQLSNVA